MKVAPRYKLLILFSLFKLRAHQVRQLGELSRGALGVSVIRNAMCHLRVRPSLIHVPLAERPQDAKTESSPLWRSDHEQGASR